MRTELVRLSEVKPGEKFIMYVDDGTEWVYIVRQFVERNHEKFFLLENSEGNIFESALSPESIVNKVIGD